MGWSRPARDSVGVTPFSFLLLLSFSSLLCFFFFFRFFIIVVSRRGTKSGFGDFIEVVSERRPAAALALDGVSRAVAADGGRAAPER